MAGSIHGSARTTPRVRAKLRASKETSSVLARRYGLSRPRCPNGAPEPRRTPRFRPSQGQDEDIRIVAKSFVSGHDHSAPHTDRTVQFLPRSWTRVVIGVRLRHHTGSSDALISPMSMPGPSTTPAFAPAAFRDRDIPLPNARAGRCGGNRRQGCCPAATVQAHCGVAARFAPNCNANTRTHGT